MTKAGQLKLAALLHAAFILKAMCSDRIFPINAGISHKRLRNHRRAIHCRAELAVNVREGNAIFKVENDFRPAAGQVWTTVEEGAISIALTVNGVTRKIETKTNNCGWFDYEALPPEDLRTYQEMAVSLI